MADKKKEPMMRITLTISFAQGLLRVEGKSKESGRLFNGDFRKTEAASLLKAIHARLVANVVSKDPVELLVDPDNFEILADQ